MQDRELTPKQRAFVTEYLIDRNATRAAIVAGYAASSAYVSGHRLLRVPKIRKELAEVAAKTSNKNELSLQRVLHEYKALAFCDITQVFHDDGSLKPLSEWPDDVRRSLSGMQIEELFERGEAGKKELTGMLKKLRFHSKPQALEALGRHLNMFPHDNNQSIGAAFQINIHLNTNDKGESE